MRQDFKGAGTKTRPGADQSWVRDHIFKKSSWVLQHCLVCDVCTVYTKLRCHRDNSQFHERCYLSVSCLWTVTRQPVAASSQEIVSYVYLFIIYRLSYTESLGAVPLVIGQEMGYTQECLLQGWQIEINNPHPLTFKRTGNLRSPANLTYTSLDNGSCSSWWEHTQTQEGTCKLYTERPRPNQEALHHHAALVSQYKKKKEKTVFITHWYSIVWLGSFKHNHKTC